MNRIANSYPDHLTKQGGKMKRKMKVLDDRQDQHNWSILL